MAMSKIRTNPVFPNEVNTLSNSLGTYWRELANTVNRHESGIVAVSAPASSTAPGTPGQIAYDSMFFYVCIANNTWKRTAIATW